MRKQCGKIRKMRRNAIMRRYTENARRIIQHFRWGGGGSCTALGECTFRAAPDSDSYACEGAPPGDGASPPHKCRWVGPDPTTFPKLACLGNGHTWGGERNTLWSWKGNTPLLILTVWGLLAGPTSPTTWPFWYAWAVKRGQGSTPPGGGGGEGQPNILIEQKSRASRRGPGPESSGGRTGPNAPRGIPQGGKEAEGSRGESGKRQRLAHGGGGTASGLGVGKIKFFCQIKTSAFFWSRENRGKRWK